MNYHTDDWIMDKVKGHYEESLQYFPKEQIVGIFYQGSGNYGLDTENSDVDTKLVVLPTLKEIALNRKPISTTHIRENNEHIDFKDARLMLQTFKKQNINFLEILFTLYKIINPTYSIFWQRLINSAEEIARYNPLQCVNSMRGVAMEKYQAMEHRYPSKINIIDKYGYDGKQLSHLVRIEEFLEKYISNIPFEDCLQSSNPSYLIDLKLNKYPLKDGREIATTSLSHIETLYKSFINKEHQINIDIEKLLEEVQYELIKQNVMWFN